MVFLLNRLNIKYIIKTTQIMFLSVNESFQLNTDALHEIYYDYFLLRDAITARVNQGESQGLLVVFKLIINN